MYNNIKGEKNLEGALNYRYWKKRIELIVEKNKVLDLVKGKDEKLRKGFSDADKVKFIEL